MRNIGSSPSKTSSLPSSPAFPSTPSSRYFSSPSILASTSSSSSFSSYSSPSSYSSSFASSLSSLSHCHCDEDLINFLIANPPEEFPNLVDVNNDIVADYSNFGQDLIFSNHQLNRLAIVEVQYLNGRASARNQKNRCREQAEIFAEACHAKFGLPTEMFIFTDQEGLIWCGVVPEEGQTI